jgi:AraC-like DNA-binding protein
MDAELAVPADEYRRCRAEDLLQAGVLELVEISDRLGYSDVQSFNRACLRWSGSRRGCTGRGGNSKDHQQRVVLIQQSPHRSRLRRRHEVSPLSSSISFAAAAISRSRTRLWSIYTNSST